MEIDFVLEYWDTEEFDDENVIGLPRKIGIECSGLVPTAPVDRAATLFNLSSLHGGGVPKIKVSPYQPVQGRDQPRIWAAFINRRLGDNAAEVIDFANGQSVLVMVSNTLEYGRKKRPHGEYEVMILDFMPGVSDIHLEVMQADTEDALRTRLRSTLKPPIEKQFASSLSEYDRSSFGRWGESIMTELGYFMRDKYNSSNRAGLDALGRELEDFLNKQALLIGVTRPRLT